MEPERIKWERISAVKAPGLVQKIADFTEETRRQEGKKAKSQPDKKEGKDG